MELSTAKTRARLRRRIKELGGVGFYGPTPARWMVIGEAPGRVEVELGRPFVGPAGKLIRKLIYEAGLDGGDAFWTNTVCYLPERKTPSQDEIVRGRKLLKSQIALSRAKFCLLLGGVAYSNFKPGGLITQGRGKPFWINGIVFMPTFHPAAALRDPGKVKFIREDLGFLRALMVLGAAFGEIWPETCAKCGEVLAEYAPDGLPYCEDHRVKVESNHKMLWLTAPTP